MVTLVSQLLTDDMVEAGKTLLASLDKAGLEISAALWLLEEDTRSWRLLLASREFDRRGPRVLYSKVRNVLTHSAHPIPLENIHLVSTDHPLVRVLGQMVETGPGIAGIRMTGNTVNGRHLEEAYVYRLLRNAA